MNFKKIIYFALMVIGIISAIPILAGNPGDGDIVKDETLPLSVKDRPNESGATDSAQDEELPQDPDFKVPAIVKKSPDSTGDAVSKTAEKSSVDSDDEVFVDARTPTAAAGEKDSVWVLNTSKEVRLRRLETPDLEDVDVGMFGVPEEDIILPNITTMLTTERSKPGHNLGKLTYLPLGEGDKWTNGEVNEHMAKFLVSDFRRNLKKYTNIFREQKGIIRINGITAVVGDIHGDYLTLRDILDRLSCDLDVNRIEHVVFLGDMLDRGPSSSITLSFLWGFFDKYPDRVHLLRGNHETLSMYVSGECTAPARNDPVLRRIDLETIRDFFDSLPYAAIINGTTLAVHGGMPHVGYWRRFWEGKKIPEYDEKNFAVVSGAMWSDYKLGGDGKIANSDRGFQPGSAAVFFDEVAVKEFLRSSGIETLSYLIRGHQAFGVPFLQTSGFEVTTVFSAVQGQPLDVRCGGAAVALVDGRNPPIDYKRFV